MSRRGGDRGGPARRQTGSRQGASRGLPQARVAAYFTRHMQVFVHTLAQLLRTPISTLLTAAVIGIALSLPGGLQALLDNVQRLSGTWEGASQISLFMETDRGESDTRALAGRIRERGDVAGVDYIAPDDALAEFRELSGFGDVLDTLESNPLPAVLVVHPARGARHPAAARRLLADLRALPGVDIAQLDLQWVKRLYAILETARSGALILGGLLGLAVLLIVGNTIRLAIENRREEIEITKLIGATDAFIRRPFLYMGVWYGLFGGVIALLLMAAALSLLNGPVQRLAGLYDSSFHLSLPGVGDAALLLLAGLLLGLVGAWLEVGRHLRAIEPH